MADDERTRLHAWDRELAAVHERLREALVLVRQGLDDGLSRDLLTFCHGFCAALGAHHSSEDAGLFPELVERRPDLRPVVDRLEQDHRAMASLIADLDRAATSGRPPAELRAHLDGLAAIMASHFGYEERALGGALAALDLTTAPERLLGPFGGLGPT